MCTIKDPGSLSFRRKNQALNQHTPPPLAKKTGQVQKDNRTTSSPPFCKHTWATLLPDTTLEDPLPTCINTIKCACTKHGPPELPRDGVEVYQLENRKTMYRMSPFPSDMTPSMCGSSPSNKQHVHHWWQVSLLLFQVLAFIELGICWRTATSCGTFLKQAIFEQYSICLSVF